MNLPQGLNPDKLQKVNFDQPQPVQHSQPTKTASQPQPQVQPQPQPQLAVQMGSPMPSNKAVKDYAETHPVLASLLKNFGLKKDEVHKNIIRYTDGSGAVTFLQTEYEESLETWAIQEGRLRAKIVGETEGMDWYQTLLASLSVVAIEDVPVYEVFGIELFEMEKHKISQNKYDISERVRKISANQLAELLVTKLNGFTEKLLEFYASKVKKNILESSIDDEKKNFEQYICPQEGCVETLYLEPRRDHSGMELPYYCKIHGVVMESITKLGENQAPLE